MFVIVTTRKVSLGGGDLRLVLAGGGTVPGLESRDDVVPLGFVSEEQKASLLRHCELLVMPSFLESLSLVMLEAWTLGRPVLVNGACMTAPATAPMATTA